MTACSLAAAARSLAFVGLEHCMSVGSLIAGITDKTEGGPFLLEAHQGDTISGNVSRHELARLVVTALSTPEAAGVSVHAASSASAMLTASLSVQLNTLPTLCLL